MTDCTRLWQPKKKGVLKKCFLRTRMKFSQSMMVSQLVSKFDYKGLVFNDLGIKID